MSNKTFRIRLEKSPRQLELAGYFKQDINVRFHQDLTIIVLL